MLGPRCRKSVTDRTKFATLEQTFNLGVLARFRPDRYGGRNPQFFSRFIFDITPKYKPSFITFFISVNDADWISSNAVIAPRVRYRESREENNEQYQYQQWRI